MIKVIAQIVAFAVFASVSYPAFAAAQGASGAQTKDIMDEPLPNAGQAATQPSVKAYASPDAHYVQKAWDKAKAGDPFLYVEDAQYVVTKIKLRVNTISSITLPKGEKVLDYSFYDKDNFGLMRCKGTPGCVFVWSNAAGFDTTLQLISDNGRIYPFYLRSYTVDSKIIPKIRIELVDTHKQENEVLGTNKTPDTKLVPQPGSEAQAVADSHKDFAEWTTTVTFDPTRIRHDLVMKGDKEIAPIDLWRDDKFIYLYYGPHSDPKNWPAVKLVEPDGTRRRVRKRKTADNQFYIIETVGPLELARGDQLVCIRFAD